MGLDGRMVVVLAAQSCPALCDAMDCIACWAPLSMEFSMQNTGVGSHFLLQGIFTSQGLNLGLLICRQILYHLSHQGNPMQGCVVLCCVLVAQSCLTLCDPMDCSPPGSSVHEIFQARILEWVAISFSRGSSQPRD